MKKTIEDIDVNGKRVLMRVDFNVPLLDGMITDDRRIKMALPTIKSVLNRGGSLTLMSHLGRPSGTGFEKEWSLAPVATRLSELLEIPVSFSDEDSTSPIVLKENVRFHAEEKNGNESFAKEFARGSDIYCNARLIRAIEGLRGRERIVQSHATMDKMRLNIYQVAQNSVNDVQRQVRGVGWIEIAFYPFYVLKDLESHLKCQPTVSDLHFR